MSETNYTGYCGLLMKSHNLDDVDAVMTYVWDWIENEEFPHDLSDKTPEEVVTYLEEEVGFNFYCSDNDNDKGSTDIVITQDFVDEDTPRFPFYGLEYMVRELKPKVLEFTRGVKND